jgi:hypothetical protein
MQTQTTKNLTASDFSHAGWRTVFHLRPQDLTTNEDVVHSDAIPGGFRISTLVEPGAMDDGTTSRSATVHMNSDRDRITLYSNGAMLAEQPGQEPLSFDAVEGGELSGGEDVSRNDDDSVSISADIAGCRTTVTVLKAVGDSVDVRVASGKNPFCGDTP